MSHSTPKNPGFAIGVGNVGDSLLEYNEGNVYLTRDGGLTWIEVVKGAHLWGSSEDGGIIILVNDQEPVSSLL